MEGVLVLKILYLLLFVLVLLITGCGGGDNKTSAPANSKPADKSAVSTEQKTNPEIEKIKKNLRFGVVEGKEYQIVKYNKDIDVTVVDITTTQKMPTRTTMGKFLLIELYVRNNGDVPIVLGMNNFHLWEVEKNGKEFIIKRQYELEIKDLVAAKAYFKDKRENPFDLKVNPGLETILVLAFEVPKDFDYENKSKLIMQISPKDKSLSITLFPKTKKRVLKYLEERAKAKQ